MPTQGDQEVKHRFVSNGINGTLASGDHAASSRTFSTTKTAQKDRNLIGIDGNWYDVTAWKRYHPGGEFLLDTFSGRDASPVFHGFHEKDVLKFWKPVGSFKTNNSDPVTQKFADLHHYFIKNGYFKTSYWWYAKKFAFAFSCLVLSFYMASRQDEDWLHVYIGALGLFSFWHQSGFFMHDFLHTHLTHEPKIDLWFGVFFGSICFGISGHWWREEHWYHHALTCGVDYTTGYRDPQLVEEIWAQNEKLFPFYPKGGLKEICIGIQHITFLPVCVFAGRVGIMIDSLIHEKRLLEWLAVIIHWSWVLFLLSFLPSWKKALVFWCLAAVMEGVLHIQLLLSHYCKPFNFVEDINTTICWYRMQIESNINIITPVWFDWFHGGLNFHIEHHLYPRMPRHNYRLASPHIKQACKEVGVEYDECGWFHALWRTLKHLRLMTVHYKLDPR